MRDRSSDAGTLREGWAAEADNWIRWVRRPGHDSYDRFHRDRFLPLLPAPGRLTLDLGCGEGRLARHLESIGHRVVGIDRQPALARAALAAGSPVAVADAAALPFAGGAFDLVVAFMTLQDMDAMAAAVAEAARVLEPGGRLCAAVVHPLNAAGRFAADEDDAPFVLEGDYFDRRRYSDSFEREGLRMTFHQQHWTIEDYFDALEGAGLLTERVREVNAPEGKWRRMPLFLHIRARR